MPDTAGSDLISPVLEQIRALHTELAQVREGGVATYIPELAKADPDWFGICLVTTNGGLYEAGDALQPFTIQSISKPFVYGLVLEDHGRAEVQTRIGVEPTGEAFNSISLDPETGRPRNPMINAGAIAATSLVEGKTTKLRFERVLEMFSRYAGRSLEVDESVWRSESLTGHRNRAIGHMLRNFGIIEEDPMPVVEQYFRQCSILVTCRDLAMMAATLANRGINPLTGVQAIRGEYVESVLGVMGTCGMYDYAGEWLHDVGLPAKSGVAGGVIAVLPGQLGIGVFSPRLDQHGNSVRGIKVCDALSRVWDLHLFNRPGIRGTAIRLKASGSEFNSHRVRPPHEVHVLQSSGNALRLYALQGNLGFAHAEFIVNELLEEAGGIECLILDFQRVLSISESACRLLSSLLLQFHDRRKQIIFTAFEQAPSLRRYLKAKLGQRFEEVVHVFDTNDAALEWGEDELLAKAKAAGSSRAMPSPGDYELFRGLDKAALHVLGEVLIRRSFHAGETLIQIGDDASELFLLAEGRVSVVIPTEGGHPKRLAAFSPGMVFGEMALLDHAPRSAIVLADTDVVCEVLTLRDYEAIGATHPAIKIRLLENLALGLCRKLRKANREIAALE
jgi:glutaminase